MRLLAAHAIEVDSLITHRLPLAEIAKGFQLVLECSEAVKVIIMPHPQESESGSPCMGQ